MALTGAHAVGDHGSVSDDNLRDLAIAAQAAALAGKLDTTVASSTYARSATALTMAAPLTGGSLQASSLLVGRPVLFKSDTTYNGFPGLCRLASGRLVATWYSAAAHPSSTPGAVIKSAYSDDQGATWSAAVTILTPDATHAYRALNLTTLANGTIQGIGWVADNTTLASVFTVASTDSGVTWSAPVTITQPFTRLSGIEAPIVVLANGTWVACAYGSNSASNNYSVAVGTSTDQGTTWSWSTTADGIADAVAYTEPTIALLPNGTLHMLIRNTTDLNMYRTTSTNNGATWSAKAVAFVGEGRPTQLVDTFGSLICIYRDTVAIGIGGRGGRVRFSRDSGVTWSAAQPASLGFQVNDYAAAVEVSPGVVAVLIAHEYSNAVADLIFEYITEHSVISPFGDSSVANRPARSLLNLGRVLAYDTLQRADESTLRRMDSGHLWVNYANNGHKLVGGNIVTVNAGNTPTGVTSGFDLAQGWGTLDTSFLLNHAGMSLLFGFQNSANFYLLNLAGTAGAITPTLYKKVANVNTSLGAGAAQNLTLTNWYPIRVTMRGTRIKIWIDGEKVLDLTDATFNTQTSVGIQNTWDDQMWGPFTVSL